MSGDLKVFLAECAYCRCPELQALATMPWVCTNGSYVSFSDRKLHLGANASTRFTTGSPGYSTVGVNFNSFGTIQTAMAACDCGFVVAVQGQLRLNNHGRLDVEQRYHRQPEPCREHRRTGHLVIPQHRRLFPALRRFKQWRRSIQETSTLNAGATTFNWSTIYATLQGAGYSTFDSSSSDLS